MMEQKATVNTERQKQIQICYTTQVRKTVEDLVFKKNHVLVGVSLFVVKIQFGAIRFQCNSIKAAQLGVRKLFTEIENHKLNLQ